MVRGGVDNVFGTLGHEVMIKILYDEFSRPGIAKGLEDYLNDGWEILKIDMVNDQEDYGVIFKKEIVK